MPDSSETNLLDRLMTLDEVCSKLRLTSGLANLRYRGEGPRAIRVGKRLMFDPLDVDVWLRSRRDAPPTPAVRARGTTRGNPRRQRARTS
jgi:hypothetical protein